MRNQGLEVAIKPPTRRYTEFAPHSCEHQLGYIRAVNLNAPMGNQESYGTFTFHPRTRAHVCLMSCISVICSLCLYRYVKIRVT